METGKDLLDLFGLNNKVDVKRNKEQGKYAHQFRFSDLMKRYTREEVKPENIIIFDVLETRFNQLNRNTYDIDNGWVLIEDAGSVFSSNVDQSLVFAVDYDLGASVKSAWTTDDFNQILCHINAHYVNSQRGENSVINSIYSKQLSEEIYSALRVVIIENVSTVLVTPLVATNGDETKIREFLKKNYTSFEYTLEILIYTI